MRSITILIGCLCSLAALLSAIANADNVSLEGPTDQGGQKKYTANGGVAAAGKYFKYTEEHPKPGGGTITETRCSFAPLNATGKLDLWVDKNTTLKDACTVEKQKPQAEDGAFQSPGGNTKLSFEIDNLTLTFNPIIIDSDFFALGSSISLDPLLGAVIEVAPLDDYIGLQDPAIPTFGAIFDTFNDIFPGVSGAGIRITKGLDVLLTAEFESLSNAPGEINFSGILSNMQFSNSIGSEIMNNLELARNLGRIITFDVLPGENLAMVTQDISPSGIASYYKDGMVTGRAGISVHAIPEPSTFALFGIGILSLLGYGWRRRKKSA